MVGRLLRQQLFAENYGRNSVLLEAAGRRELGFAPEECVHSRCRAIARVIIPHPAHLTARRPDDNVSAIHGIKIVFRCVVLRSCFGGERCGNFNFVSLNVDTHSEELNEKLTSFHKFFCSYFPVFNSTK